MVARDERDDLDLLRIEAPQVAVLDQVVRVPVMALGGVVPEKPIKALQSSFDEIISINPPGIDKQQALLSARNNLVATAKHIGDLIAEGRLL